MDRTGEEYQRALEAAKQADSVRAFRCHNPDCLRMHVVLLDEQGHPFSHFVVPDNWKFLINGLPDGGS